MTHTFDPRSLSQPGDLGLAEAAARLGVEEAILLSWLAAFGWERHYDGSGALRLGEQDLEFLRVVKSLRDIDRSCDSIVRLLAEDGDEPPPEVLVDEGAEHAVAGMAQIETLKAELRDLHASPHRSAPFWRFWRRA
ncbi:MAG: MerR family transcriptional regulator [Candidatus Sericytochromatia bacterium]|nr:MerR family transcriptional regulator [Candidatus Sericytochromatia bacterium]